MENGTECKSILKTKNKEQEPNTIGPSTSCLVQRNIKSEAKQSMIGQVRFKKLLVWEKRSIYRSSISNAISDRGKIHLDKKSQLHLTRQYFST